MFAGIEAALSKGTTPFGEAVHNLAKLTTHFIFNSLRPTFITGNPVDLSKDRPQADQLHAHIAPGFLAETVIVRDFEGTAWL